MDSKRVQVILTTDMVSVMQSIAAKKGSSVSALYRLSVSHWLKDVYGINISDKLQWGGKRIHKIDNSAEIPPNPLV